MTRIDGAFRGFPLGVRKIGRVGASGQPLLLRDLLGNEEWIANPEWFRHAGIRSFAAQSTGRDELILNENSAVMAYSAGPACQRGPHFTKKLRLAKTT